MYHVIAVKEAQCRIRDVAVRQDTNEQVSGAGIPEQTGQIRIDEQVGGRTVLCFPAKNPLWGDWHRLAGLTHRHTRMALACTAACHLLKPISAVTSLQSSLQPVDDCHVPVKSKLLGQNHCHAVLRCWHCNASDLSAQLHSGWHCCIAADLLHFSKVAHEPCWSATCFAHSPALAHIQMHVLSEDRHR